MYHFVLEIYRNAAGLCGFILYPATLLKLLIISTSFLVNSLGFFKYTIISFAKRDSLVSSLPIQYLQLFFITMLNNRGDTGHPCFITNLIRKASSLSLLLCFFLSHSLCSIGIICSLNVY
uniref:Uncharacterized protein n=1 Tax=Monodelphis domestica TaxID=13616 RepID=A0A5F8G7N3_MONDO